MIRLKRFLDLWLYYSIIKVWPIIMPQLLTNTYKVNYTLFSHLTRIKKMRLVTQDMFP
jgi:hypothetical protein